MRPFDKNFGAVSLAVILVMTAMSPATAQLVPTSSLNAKNCNNQSSSSGAQNNPIKETQFNSNDFRIDKNEKLTLSRALELANQNNKSIKTACSKIKQSTAGINAAQASDAPSLGFTGSLDNNGAPLFFDRSSTSQFRANGTLVQGGLEATYKLNNTLFGQTNNKAAAAKQQLEFDKLAVENVTRTVLANVIKAYYDLQDADEQFKISNSAVKNAQESLRNAQIQEKAGLGTRFDVIRADVQKSTAQQDMVKAKNQQQVAKKALAQLLNISEKTEYSAADLVKEKSPWKKNLDESIAEALNNRPELKQQKIQRDISNFGAKDAENIPQYSLFANYSLSKDLQSAAGFGDNYGFGARINFSLLDGGAASAKTEQQQVGASIAETQYTLVRSQVRFQVEQNYSSLQSNQQNMITAKGAQAQAQESLRLARLRLAAGVGTQLDVINADTELTKAKSNYSKAIIDYNRVLASLNNYSVGQQSLANQQSTTNQQ